jgi:hypothetical protein
MNDRLSLPTTIVICVLAAIAVPIMKFSEWHYRREQKKKMIRLRIEQP